MRSIRWRRLAPALAVATLGVALPLAVAPPSDTTQGPRLPAALVELALRVGVRPRDFKTVAEGRPLAYQRPITRDDEVAIVGVVRIDVPARFFEQRYRDVARFEPPKRLLDAGVLSVPAVAGDVRRLALPEGDIADLESCRLGDCPVHLDRELLAKFPTVEWEKTGAKATAQALVRSWVVDYANAYLGRGNAALFTYGHRTPTRAHFDDARALVRADDLLRAAAPRMAAYLDNMDAVGAPFPADEFLYWSLLKLTRKSIARINHVVIAPSVVGDVPVGVIVSRTIFASHYLRDGLEVLVLVPGPGAGPVASEEASPAVSRSPTYLVLSSRSHCDDLLGIRGVLIRGLVRRRARGSLEKYLGELKQRLEASYQSSKTSP